MSDIIQIIVNFAESLGYTWIFIMMVLESSFIPFPSEVAMIPAWYFASQGTMDFSIALLIGTFWALVWATINYYIWYFLWEIVIINFIAKYWRYFLIKEKHYIKAENYFLKHWAITTFLARFITVIRQIISLPAWVFRMNFAKFFFYTGLWAGIWNLMLMLIWYTAGKNKELIANYSKELLIFSILFVIIVWVIYYFVNKKNENRKY